MIAPFLIAALANTLKAAALPATAERIGDADWVRPDIKRIGGGVLADGVTTMPSGAFCEPQIVGVCRCEECQRRTGLLPYVRHDALLGSRCVSRPVRPRCWRI